MRTMMNIVVSSAAMLAVPRVMVWTRARLTVRCAGLGPRADSLAKASLARVSDLCEPRRVSIRWSTPEGLEGWMPKSGSPMRYGVAVAGAGQPSPISWLDSPGDFVRLRFSNI